LGAQEEKKEKNEPEVVSIEKHSGRVNPKDANQYSSIGNRGEKRPGKRGKQRLEPKISWATTRGVQEKAS